MSSSWAISWSAVILLALSWPISAAETTPGDAYLKFHAARQKATSTNDLLPFLTGTAQGKMPKGGGLVELQLIKALTPGTVKVIKQEISGDKATVFLQAFSTDSTVKLMPGKTPETTTGEINMIRDGGEWKVDHESWTTRSISGTTASATKPTKSDPWCADVYKMPFSQKPAAGAIAGQAFKVDQAEMWNDVLTLTEGTDFMGDRTMKIFLFSKGSVENKSITVKNDTGFDAPHVHLSWKDGSGKFQSKVFTGQDKYGMRLQLKQKKDDLLPGYIVLRLPDRSYVEGYFYAKMK